jgi:short-subunit dehydrogenase
MGVMLTQNPATNALRLCTMVTGAASGIGRSFAVEMARRGEGLVLLDRSANDLEQLAQQLRRAHGVEADVVVVDLADPGARLSLMRHLHRRRLRVRSLINCAGVGVHRKFAAHGRKSIDQVIDVNARAVVHLTRLFVRHMIRHRQGMILNVSSTAAFEKMPDWAVYGATKAFVQSFSESLQEELEGSGVYVALVCPGPTSTPFFAAAGLDEASIPARQQTADEVVAEAMVGLDQRRKMIVTGSHNRMKIALQRISVRSILQSLLRCLRRLRLAP